MPEPRRATRRCLHACSHLCPGVPFEPRTASQEGYFLHKSMFLTPQLLNCLVFVQPEVFRPFTTGSRSKYHASGITCGSEDQIGTTPAHVKKRCPRPTARGVGPAAPLQPKAQPHSACMCASLSSACCSIWSFGYAASCAPVLRPLTNACHTEPLPGCNALLRTADSSSLSGLGKLASSHGMRTCVLACVCWSGVWDRQVHRGAIRPE